MEAGKCLISQHAQVVGLGLIDKQLSIVLEDIRLLTERCSSVLQLSLQLQDVLADLL